MPKRLISLVLLLVATAVWGNSASEETGDVIGCVDPGDTTVPLEETNLALLNTLVPFYPKHLLKAGWEGECIVHLSIDENGEAVGAGIYSSSDIYHSTGNKEADKAAMMIALHSEWEPATQDGKPVAIHVRIPISFTLGGLTVEQTELVPLNSLEPFYPESLIGTGWEGECTVELYIDENCEVVKVYKVRSSGEREADKIALAVAQNSKWESITGSDRVIARQMDVTISFSLDNARGVTPAEPLSVPNPVYPAHLRESNWNGQTRLGLSIDDLGMVLKAWVIDTSGSQIADEAARQMAFASLWQPAEYLGEPLDSQAELVVEFSLDTSADEVADALDEDWAGPEEDDWEPPENLNNPGAGDAPKR